MWDFGIPYLTKNERFSKLCDFLRGTNVATTVWLWSHWSFNNTNALDKPCSLAKGDSLAVVAFLDHRCKGSFWEILYLYKLDCEIIGEEEIKTFMKASRITLAEPEYALRLYRILLACYSPSRLHRKNTSALMIPLLYREMHLSCKVVRLIIQKQSCPRVYSRTSLKYRRFRGLSVTKRSCNNKAREIW